MNFAHTCREEHPWIGHNDSEHELCPLCRTLNERDAIAAELAALKAEFNQPVPLSDWQKMEAEVSRLMDELHRTVCEKNDRIDALAAEFKNFHRLLCERFGYGHDEVDWRRDQLSLIEHIAARVQAPEAALREVLASCGPFIPADNVPGDHLTWITRYLSAVERARAALEPPHG